MKENGTSTSNYIDSGTKWSTFDDKIDASLKKLKQKLEEYSQKDIAIYCPKRALNALSIIGINDCRLVDDTVDMFGN